MVSFLSNLSNFFVPSAEEGARRRLSTFGTESKLVATGVIGGTAVALIAAPILVTSATARSAVFGAIKQVVSLAVRNPKTTLVSAVVLPTAVSYFAEAPVQTVKDVSKGAATFVSEGATLGTQAAQLRQGKITAEEFIKNNQTALLAGGIALATVLGIAAIPAIASFLNTRAVKENTKATINAVIPPTEEKKNKETVMQDAVNEVHPASVSGESSLVAPVTDSSIKSPMKPTTKSSNTGVKRRKKAKETSRISQSVRVNITDDRDVTDRKVFKQQRG